MADGSNGGNAESRYVTWMQFVVVVIPMLISIAIGAHFLIKETENRLVKQIDKQEEKLDILQRQSSKIQSDITVIKLEVSKKR